MPYLLPHAGSLMLVAALVILAIVVNRFARDKRRYLRHFALLVLMHLSLLGISYGLDAVRLGGGPSLRSSSEVIELLGWASALLITVFHLVLPTLRVRVASIVSDLAAAAFYFVALFIGLKRTGFDLSSLLATSAVVTAILALSLQATLGNVIGGLALQLDDSVRVGDWIQLEGGRQGLVKQIRWRHTVLETRDWDTLLVPNAALLQAQILILGKREGQPLQHRMWVYFNVDFRFSPNEVIQAVETALSDAKIPGVADTPKPNCVCMDFARDHKDSFALYAVRYWLTDIARDDPTNSLVRERVFSALKRGGIPLAVPAAHLWVENDSEERRQRKKDRERERRIKSLSSVPFFAPFTQEELGEVSDQLLSAPFAEGEIVTRQGAVAHFLYIIAEGSVDVCVASGAGETIVARIDAPGIFGERGLMTGEPRAATIVAVTDVECYRLNKTTFKKLLGQRPELAAEISESFAERQVALEDAKEHLDAAGRRARLVERKSELLSRIQGFFGLEDSPRSK